MQSFAISYKCKVTCGSARYAGVPNWRLNISLPHIVDTPELGRYLMPRA